MDRPLFPSLHAVSTLACTDSKSIVANQHIVRYTAGLGSVCNG